MICKVKKIASPLNFNADWNSPPWKCISPELLQNYMGQKPQHFPKTEVKVAYSNTSVSLIFRVEDRYIRAVAPKHQGNVCKDSCVEFFFTPSEDLSLGYFNLEINCGGTMLFKFQPSPGNCRSSISEKECSSLSVSHTLPRIIEPEIAGPLTWTVEYSIPFDLLEKYSQVIRPEPGVTWRANFYKCADNCSHPHWLTWSPVDLPEPNFHFPASFGTLLFE